MKTLAIILFAASLSTGLVSCNKLKHAKFTADYSTDLTIPKRDNNGTDTLYGQDINTNIETIMKDNNTSTDLVKSVRIQTVTLDLVSPTDKDFSCLTDLRVFLSSENAPEIEVASKHNISEHSRQIVLTLGDIELKPYLISDIVKVRVISQNGASIPEDLHVNAKFKFKFEADLLAAL